MNQCHANIIAFVIEGIVVLVVAQIPYLYKSTALKLLCVHTRS